MDRLRRRRPEDLPAVVSWIPDAVALHRFAGSSLQWPLTAPALAGSAAADGVTAWVLDHEGEVAGHVRMTWNGPAVRFGHVLVDPALRGRGLGRRLVVLALEQARAEGAERIDLVVVEGNDVAQRLYEALGFTLTGQRSPDGALGMSRPAGGACA